MHKSILEYKDKIYKLYIQNDIIMYIRECDNMKKQVNIRLDDVTRELIKAMVEKYKAEGTTLTSQSAIIEKAVNAFAYNVLGRKECEQIIDKYYDDPLGIWAAMHKKPLGPD